MMFSGDDHATLFDGGCSTLTTTLVAVFHVVISRLLQLLSICLLVFGVILCSCCSINLSCVHYLIMVGVS
jgi:hypothetical protein